MRPRFDEDEDDDWIDGKPPVVGTAQPRPTEQRSDAGVLWVPDPEQRRGWREFYIKKPLTRSARSVGFGKPGQR